MFPVPKKEEYITQFGLIKDGSFRGNEIDKLMNPPLCIKDNYYWIRDDNRTNKDVLDHINNSYYVNFHQNFCKDSNTHN